VAKLAETAKDAALAVAGLTKSFVEYGIQQSSIRETQSAILAKLGGNYDTTIHLAAKYGLNADEATAEVKELLQAKFSQQEIDVDIKIAAAIDAVEGGGKGQEFLHKLEEIKLKPKVDAKEIKSLASLGLDTNLVYAELAKKLHTNVAGAMAKVKAGAVDTKDVIDAIEKAGDKSFGGLADKLANSIPGLLNRVRIYIADLFSGFNLDPLKDALRNAAELLEGPEGKALKQSFSEAGSAIIDALFSPFRGEEGKGRMRTMVLELIGLMKALKEAAEAAKPVLHFLADVFAHPTSKEGFSKSLQDIQKKTTGQATTGIGTDHADTFSKIFGNVGPAANDSFISPLSDLMGPANDNGGQVGQNIVDGLTNAITGNAGEPIGAVEALIAQVIAAAHAAADAHSPSRKMGILGGFMDQGLAGGMDDSDASTRAGASMVNRASGAAAAAAGGSAGGLGGPKAGGAGGGGGNTYNVTIMQPPGATKKEGEDFAEGFNRKMRELAAEAA
jgi:hypothetical protein